MRKSHSFCSPPALSSGGQSHGRASAHDKSFQCPTQCVLPFKRPSSGVLFQDCW